MAWLAAVVDWQGADRSDSIRILLRPEPWQTAIATGRNAIASWGHGRGRPDEPTSEPRDEGGIVVLWDGRLDNEAELRRALDTPHASSSELLARGYRKWGRALAEKVVGDLAVVILDGVERQVLAFRDPSGVRPLAYHDDGRVLTLASDPAQLLRLPQLDRTPDEETIVEHLLRRGTSLERTFFRAIKRLPPGHRLVAREGARTIEAFVRPPPEDATLDSPEVVLEEMRARLSESVRDRGRGPQPVAAYLSGGVDSSVIVCAAAALARDGHMPRLACTLSARYPGQPQDEGAFIELVSQQTGIPSLEWDATGRLPRASEVPTPVPPFLTEPSDLETPEWATVVDAGIRVILDGVGGDEVGAFPGVMEDLGRRRRWRTAIARIAAAGIDRGLRGRRAWTFARGAFGAELPRTHARTRAVRSRLQRLPSWLTPHGRELARASLDRGWTGGGPFASAAQATIWARITAPFFIDGLERLHRRGIFMGVDRRYPFLDRRVVDLALRLPLEYRLMAPYRRLHQSAFASLLPAQIAARETKANFDESLIDRVRALAPVIDETLKRGPWVCAGIVDRGRAQAAADRLHVSPDRHGARHHEAVSKITALELWLRQRA